MSLYEVYAHYTTTGYYNVVVGYRNGCRVSYVGLRMQTYVCICMYIYVCMYVCMYVSMYVCMYVCMYVSMYVCMYLCMYVRICMYVCTYLCVCNYYVCTAFIYFFLTNVEMTL